MKTEFKEIENILNILKSRIDAHNKFKKEYDRQLALDFSLFQFFSVGENKISQVLAYFLDVNQNHGQGDMFLSEFLNAFTEKEIVIEQIANVCEKIITNKRRLDVYIKLKELTIGIENKVWADDQDNQLKDYSQYLEKNTNGNYVLFYLNPYGTEPNPNSIDKKLSQKLCRESKLKVISYKQDLIPLINTWLINCEADNVSYFLKEFKKHLEVKILGKNTLNMSKELREIIYNNEKEIQYLVNEYKKIENEVLAKLNAVGKELDKLNPIVNENISVSKSGLFNWEGSRVYKYSISDGNNMVWVQLIKREIHLYSNHYLQDDKDVIFNEILSGLGINRWKKIDYKQTKSDLIKIFLEQVEIANQSFREYGKQIGTE